MAPASMAERNARGRHSGRKLGIAAVRAAGIFGLPNWLAGGAAGLLGARGFL
jgi:hypothetical protein